MKSEPLTEVFNKPGSRNVRLALSLLFIMLATIVIMTVFQVAKHFLDSDMTIWESHIYTIIFAGIIAPLIALFVLLRFEGLYGKVTEENEERKRAEKSLVKDRYILTKSQEAAHVGNWAWHLQTGEITGSAENYRIFGYEPGEVKATLEWVLSRTLSEDRVALADFMGARAQDGTRGSIDYRIRRPDGSVGYLNTIVDKAVRDGSGRITRLYGISQDITKRKLAEEAFRVSEEKFRMMADFTYDWESWLGTNGKYVYVSPSCERITGHSSDEFYRDPGLLLKLVHPDDLAAYEQHQEDHFIQGVDNGGIDFRILTARGETRWISHVCQPVYGNNGEWLGYRSSNRDITERNRAEEELKDAKAQSELYLDLMGHDINNYNQVALGYLELIEDKVEDKDLKDLIYKSLDAVSSSSYLIENVRKLQKVKTREFKSMAVDLNEILSELRAQYSKVPDKDVTINYTDGSCCAVMADGLIKDVFSNLIWNAIKHSNDGSVQVNLGLERHMEDGKEYCKVIVEDDGPGIPDIQKEKVFTRFQRGNTKASGKGLGLYLVRTLVEGYHGRVWVEDRVPGDHAKGCRFVVMLPAVEK